MPVTNKDDVRLFGNNITNILSTWGEQIQHAKDTETYTSIMKNLSDVKKLTTDKDGNIKSGMDLATDMFKTNTKINTMIQDPILKQHAGMTVSDLYKGLLTGLGTQEQKKQDVGQVGQANPNMSQEQLGQLYNFGQPSMTKASGPGIDKYYAPKIIYDNNPDDPNKVDSYEVGITQKGTPYKIKTGTLDRSKLSAPELFEMEKLKIQGAMDTRAVPTRSSSFNTSLNMTPQRDTYIDNSGNEKTVIFKNGKPYEAGTNKPIKDMTGWKPTGDLSLNPPKGSTKSELSPTDPYYTRVEAMGKAFKEIAGNKVDGQESELMYKDILVNGVASKYWEGTPNNFKKELVRLGLVENLYNYWKDTEKETF